MTEPVARASGARAAILIATLALAGLATALALVGRLSGDRPSSTATLLLAATTCNVVCAVVSITARTIQRPFGWWLCSAVLLGAAIAYASLGEMLSGWALLVCVVAATATVAAVIQLRRPHPPTEPHRPSSRIDS